MKYRYHLNNLDCPNCANKIECLLKEDEKIEKATVNFSKLTVSVETTLKNNVKEYIANIAHQVEPEVEILEMEEENKKSSILYDVIRLSLGVIVALVGMFFFHNTVSKVIILVGYLILLFRTIKNAWKLLFRSKTINENFLVTVSCIGAFFTDNIHEGLMVIVLYEIGKILEAIAVNRSRKSIQELMDIKPTYANIKQGEKIVSVKPETVKVKDVIVIKPGEKVPLDGVIIKGTSKLNVAALTGESKLKNVKEGEEILSGSINTDGLLEIEVTKLYVDSTVSRILELVETATDRKAKTETFVAKAARIYTPVILVLAILTGILLPTVFHLSIEDSIYRALCFLVVSCPCAIAISVPLSYFSGIGKASKEGILIKGSDYLDHFGKMNKIIFDKTGTITTGEFSDYLLETFEKDYTKDEILSYYVTGEAFSNHPIAKSILALFEGQKQYKNATNFKEHAGKGISYEIEKKKIKIGSSTYCGNKENNSAIYLNINGKVIAKLDLRDGIKKDAISSITALKKLGIKTKMFTGDSKDVAIAIAEKVGIDEVCYELLPEDKYHLLEKELEAKDEITAFVGDGINDAPSLALADIGISMGGVGSAAAIEASDIVIMQDELSKIVDGISISKKTNRIIKQNLIFAIGVKVIVLVLSTLGIASMWQAVFADTGLTLLTILNTTRILK